jgi:hypothetical protein
MESHGPDLLPCGDLDTSNDVVIAQMLQSDFDAEHNQQLKHVEDKLNGSNKGFSPYVCVNCWISQFYAAD